jgi:hypothetical protein
MQNTWMMPSRFSSSLRLEYSASHSSGAFIPLSTSLSLADSRSSACSLTPTPQDRPEKETVGLRWQLGQPWCKPAPESCRLASTDFPTNWVGWPIIWSRTGGRGLSRLTGHLGSLERDREREVFPSGFLDSSNYDGTPPLCIDCATGAPFWGKSPGLTPHIKAGTMAKPSFDSPLLEPRT